MTDPMGADAMSEAMHGAGVTIPAGMKSWHGGTTAPADWRGGRVLWSDGNDGRPAGPRGWERDDAAPYVIAYTPTPPDIAHTHPDTYALSDAGPAVIGAEGVLCALRDLRRAVEEAGVHRTDDKISAAFEQATVVLVRGY